jgi:hypothetical protein
MKLEKQHKGAVQEVIDRYPETSKEFLNQQEIQWDLFCRKQLDYGPGNIAMGTNLTTEDDLRKSQIGIVVRMNDKMQRLVNLVMSNREPNNESIDDTLIDISNYAIMMSIVRNKKWGK